MVQRAASELTERHQEIVVLEVGDILCGIDLTRIQEINKQVDITAVHHAPSYVRGVVNLRGQIVTVIDLRSKFALPALSINDEQRIVVVSWEGENIGLLVDKVRDIAVTDASAILNPPANVQGVSGAFFAGIYPLDKGLVALLRLSELLEPGALAVV
ncbi:MAG: chemotaxis protein CheW [Candidatus Tectimicrobiota bacterium]